MSFVQFGKPFAPSDVTMEDKFAGLNAVINALYSELIASGVDPKSLSLMNEKITPDIGDKAKWFAGEIISKLGK